MAEARCCHGTTGEVKAGQRQDELSQSSSWWRLITPTCSFTAGTGHCVPFITLQVRTVLVSPRRRRRRTIRVEQSARGHTAAKGQGKDSSLFHAAQRGQGWAAGKLNHALWNVSIIKTKKQRTITIFSRFQKQSKRLVGTSNAAETCNLAGETLQSHAPAKLLTPMCTQEVFFSVCSHGFINMGLSCAVCGLACLTTHGAGAGQATLSPAFSTGKMELFPALEWLQRPEKLTRKGPP